VGKVLLLRRARGHVLHDACLSDGRAQNTAPLETEMVASQFFRCATRVFDERFPKLVLYVNDVSPAGRNGTAVPLRGREWLALTLAENAI